MYASPEKYIGQTAMMTCGLNATIIAYSSWDDITVRFENGIERHTCLKSFQRKCIGLPKDMSKKYVGQTRVMNCGIKATIITYRKYKDIDVKFENNIVRKHVSIRAFEDGEIGPEPNMTTDDNKERYIGMSRTMNCGMKATIIAYRAYNDIDVRFENNEIRKHAWLHYFKTGSLAPKNIVKNTAANRYIGMTRMMNCGLNATIIEYRNNSDIDVQFEDGTIHKHTRISNFNTNRIAPKHINSSFHVTGTLFDIFQIHDKAFVFHNTTYFYVSYILDDVEQYDIMSVNDMKQLQNKLQQN